MSTFKRFLAGMGIVSAYLLSPNPYLLITGLIITIVLMLINFEREKVLLKIAHKAGYRKVIVRLLRIDVER